MAMEREMSRVPITTAEGMTILLAPGEHSQLIKRFMEAFVPHFVPGSRVLFMGDVGGKYEYFDEEGLRAFGVDVDVRDNMPDVLLHDSTKNLLLLVEAVTSHGPIDEKRRDELAKLFNRSTAVLLYVSVFATRDDLVRYAEEIAWETEVWISEAPTHMIHFDGERLFGPYDRITA
jgi:adenine-specific DNA-methyltransferase